MSVIEYILLAFALAVPTMVTVRGCAVKNPIRLTRGLGVSFLIALEHTLLLLAGILVGNLLRFDIPDYDNLIYLGMLVIVAGRMFFMAFSKKEKPSYDIASWLTVLLLGVATGINSLFVGLGLGFRVLVENELWKVGIPLIVVIFLFAYLGIMLGRRKKQVRVRRWMLLGMLFLLIFAVKGAFF
jgi:putative Mn2+ efflux pump MntP